MKKIWCWLLLASLITTGCQSDEYNDSKDVATYLFLGHPYDWHYHNRIDIRLELLDYSAFDAVWLGGDVCARTSKQQETLVYLDSLLNISKPETLWTWGNHDIMEGNPVLLKQATGRPPYYSWYKEGLLVIVLNTNYFWFNEWNPPQTYCEIKAAQLTWLHAQLDTIQEASQLVLLGHHALFADMRIDSIGKPLRLANINASKVRPDCRVDGDFTEEIYPQLVTLQKAGVEVISLAGDVGMNNKGYAVWTRDSIALLGSGINNTLSKNSVPEYVTNLHPDTVLLLKHDLHKRELGWEFVRLTDLLPADVVEKDTTGRLKILMEAY